MTSTTTVLIGLAWVALWRSKRRRIEAALEAIEEAVLVAISL
jgi:uncharacterized membrane protein